MAQAGIAVAKVPLASSQPTVPPHPHDVARRLSQRQVTAETCGWVDGQSDEPYACGLGSVCAYNTELFAMFCCDTASFPTSCFYPTTCYDSSAAANLCPGPCSNDPANIICTSAGAEYCVTDIFEYSAIPDYLWTYSCTDVPGGITTIYDRISGAASSNLVVATAVGVTDGPVLAGVVLSSSLSPSTSALVSPTTTSTTPLSPVTATPTAVPTLGPKRGLSNGAIAGIVVGAVLFLLIALGMILLYRFFKGRKSPPPPPPQQLIRDTTTQPTSMATAQTGSPTLSNPASMPSNAPLYSPTMNELSPEDSKLGSYPTSHSAVGAFPQFSAQHGGQPPPSPRTESRSMNPVHAPDGNSEYTFVSKGPQQ